jgi:hypothetical protein
VRIDGPLRCRRLLEKLAKAVFAVGVVIHGTNSAGAGIVPAVAAPVCHTSERPVGGHVDLLDWSEGNLSSVGFCRNCWRPARAIIWNHPETTFPNLEVARFQDPTLVIRGFSARSTGGALRDRWLTSVNPSGCGFAPQAR